MMKNLIKQYIELLETVSTLESNLNTAFSKLNPDNDICSIIPDDYSGFVEQLLRAYIGENRMDWLLWWLYDVNQRSSIITIDGIEYEINNFDNLWEHCLKNEV